MLVWVPHPCYLHPHPHTKARSSKTIRRIFLKLSYIVLNNITVTNLHLIFVLTVHAFWCSIPLKGQRIFFYVPEQCAWFLYAKIIVYIVVEPHFDYKFSKMRLLFFKYNCLIYKHRTVKFVIVFIIIVRIEVVIIIVTWIVF